MDYRLESGTPVELGLRLVASAEIHAALDNARLLPEAHAVHELRKHCKKLRALLRLVYRDKNLRYKLENNRYRNIAQRLSASRDLVSVRAALLSLAPPAHFEKMHRLLQQMLNAEPEQGSFQRVEELLTQAQADIHKWPPQNIHWEDIASAYSRDYRRARKAWMATRYGDNAYKLHQLRKRVKSHWYHSRLLGGRYPQSIEIRCEPLGQLAQILGDWRDLFLLRILAITTSESLGKELIRLLEMTDGQKERLRREIDARCRALFAHKTLSEGKASV
ncbi:CHAD domain-containing protein [uncultured Microbulbifer sp.]|uniref:CHAD domain-containing protein n=1 Tax=uncultured Microbulbifer sp. TaxID=348147 RepID=UPI002616D4C1|nr:CHAD domain-containing protein [uncultured Microbulbifer sp.]